MIYQIDILSAQKLSCLSRCVRALIVVVKSDPSSTVGFPDFVENNFQTNGCIPLRIECSAFFSETIATFLVFLKKQAIICLKMLCARATFIRFGSS